MPQATKRIALRIPTTVLAAMDAMIHARRHQPTWRNDVYQKKLTRSAIAVAALERCLALEATKEDIFPPPAKPAEKPTLA